MFEEKVRFIIQEKYIELVNTVIDELKGLPVQNIQDNNDNVFDSVWEAFVNQLQEEDSGPYHAYTHVIENICQQVTQSLTLTELKLLWLVSGGYSNWEEESDFPDVERMLDEVTEELLSWVEQEAEDAEFEEEGEYDDDDDDDYYDKGHTKH